VSELAYLAGGPRRVLLSALTALVERGVVDAAFRPRREPTADDALDEVQLAVLRSLGTRGRTDFGELRADCGPAVSAIRDRLRTRGLVPSAGVRDIPWFRAGVAGAVVVAVVLVAVLPSSVGFVAVWGLVVAAVLADRLRRRPAQRAARAAMGHARRRHSALDPRYTPAYGSYGGDALSTAVALFGVTALGLALPTVVDTPLVAALGAHGTSSGSSAFLGSACGSGPSGACSSSCSGASGGADGSSCGSSGGCGSSSCGGGGCGGCGGGGGD